MSNIGKSLPAFLDELEKIATKQEHPAPRAGSSCGYELRNDNGVLIIEKLWVAPRLRGKGVATRLLQQIKDAHPDRTLGVRPRPFEDMPMSIDDLKKFYEKNGFKVVDNKDNMLYIPKK